MPELPEITVISSQMQHLLVGKTISEVEMRQEKCLNAPRGTIVSLLESRQVLEVAPLGKWISITLDGDSRMLLNLGMGADVVYYGDSRDYYRRLSPPQWKPLADLVVVLRHQSIDTRGKIVEVERLMKDYVGFRTLCAAANVVVACDNDYRDLRMTRLRLIHQFTTPGPRYIQVCHQAVGTGGLKGNPSLIGV